jgi:UDP-N-acetylmuramoylalanine--D-glutamate ligase
MSLSEYLPEQYVALMHRPVAIFGVGPSGLAAAELIRKLGGEPVHFDALSGEAEVVQHEFSRKTALEFGLVIHGPAFWRHHPWIEMARQAGCTVVSEMDFAQQIRRGPTLVVTGTNGKTTLQEFITFSLKRSGVSAVAAGQNHYPLSRLAIRPELDGVTAVLELSPTYAQQVERFRFDALFWTNFHEDHLEESEQRRLFTDIMILAEGSPEGRLYFGESVYARAADFGLILPERARRLKAEDFPSWELSNRSAFATSLHQPALALYRCYWLDKGYSDSLLKGAAENFEVRAHRLHVSTVIGKTTYWNDANASNFAATEAALEHFKEPVVWIGGGQYRGGDLEAFSDRVHKRLRGAVLYGNTREAIASHLTHRGVNNCLAEDLRNAVELAFGMAAGECPVVFSPGFPAGDEFGSAVERGICYENAVLGLKHQKGSS